MILKLILILLIAIFLSGCIPQTDKQARPTPFRAASLAVPHTYSIPTRNYYISWWQKFNDAQLNRLILLGLQDSPTIKIAQSRLRRTYEITKLTATSLWPIVTLDGYEQRQRFSQYGLVPPPFNGKTFNIAEIGLNFSYEFDFWGKYRESSAAHANAACAAYAELAAARLVLATAIAAQYFQLQTYAADLKIANSLLKQQQTLYVIVAARGKHDIASDIPVKTAQANVETAHIRVREYENAVADAEQKLAVLIGKNPLNTKIAKRRFYFLQYRYKLPVSIPANLLANRPDILAAHYTAQAAAHKINAAKALFFPNIDLLGLLSRQSIRFGKLLNPASQNNLIEGAIDLPIFDAGARQANLGIAYAEYTIAVNQYNKTILNALYEVAAQVTSLSTLNSELKTQLNTVKTIAQNNRLLQLQYRHGIIEYEQVIINKTKLLEEKLRLINLQAQYLTTIVNLYKSLGGYEQG